MENQNNQAPVAPAQQQGGGGDMLDKGLDFIAKKSGHAQNRGMIEKISDGIRTMFKRLTGKDIPIKDQEYK